MSKSVLVYCETVDGSLTPMAVELLGGGSRLASAMEGELCAVLIGSDIAGPAQEAIACGSQKVYTSEDPALKDYSTEPYLAVLEKVIQLAAPEIVLMGQTSTGRDLAPWLAFRLNTGATMDCTALEIDPDSKRLLMTRPVYGGNAQAVQVCESSPQIATVRNKALAPAGKDSSRQGQVIKIEAGIDPAALRTRVVERKVEAVTGIRLEDARVVVSGGRGIGSMEGFKQLQEIADILKGAVGATRPPCDKKWIADTQQIGLTGKVVGPDLYIAVALSGASQHISGFSSAKVIVAINKDPEANIFRVANYGIVADWKAVLPAFTAKLKEVAG
ncbi:MAG: electron transfer flavoprotein subunit alpha/FixB family protein [Dehalococcoidales bacterium]|nr:electron transfer flavoprotein subunit alpha/FixB family protein [Dehalococcoidales bacterium]